MGTGWSGSLLWTCWSVLGPWTCGISGVYLSVYHTVFVSCPGEDHLLRYLSNERISTVPEEEPRPPLPYRGGPAVRGADHVRGSRCFMGSDLLHGAPLRYQEEVQTGAEVGSAQPGRTKTSTSLLGGWLARLRLLSH